MNAARQYVLPSKREHDASSFAAELGQRFGYEAAHATPLDWRHTCQSAEDLAPALALAVAEFERLEHRPMRAAESQACRTATVLYYGMAHEERRTRARECGRAHGDLPQHLRAL